MWGHTEKVAVYKPGREVPPETNLMVALVLDFQSLGLWENKFLCLNNLCCVSRFSSVWLFATLWTIAYQAPLSMRFSRQEYWSGLPCPSPGVLSGSVIKPRSPTLQADSLPTEPPEKQSGLCYFVKVVWTNWYTYLLHILKHPYENINAPREELRKGLLSVIPSLVLVIQAAFSFTMKWNTGTWRWKLAADSARLGFPGGSDGKETACNAGDTGSSLSWEYPLEEGMATTPAFWPGESHGQRSLVGYSLWGHKKSDMTEWLSTAQQKIGRGSESQRFCSTDLINAKTRVQNSGNYLDL